MKKNKFLYQFLGAVSVILFLYIKGDAFPPSPPSSSTTSLTSSDIGSTVQGYIGAAVSAEPWYYLFFGQTYTAFTASDTTPNVRVGGHFKTANIVTITDFDDGGDSSTLTDGETVYILCLHAGTFDFTSSGLFSPYGEDYTMVVGSVEIFQYDLNNTRWVWVSPKAPIATISANGFIARISSGVPASRTFGTSSAGIDVTNGDGVSGNPSIDLDLAPSSGSATLVQEEDALQVKYDGSLTESASGLGINHAADIGLTGTETIGDGGDDIMIELGTNATDGHWSGLTITATVKTGSAAELYGQAMFINASGELEAADADVGSAAAMPAIGLLVDAGEGASKKCLISGTITETDWNWTVGNIIYVGTNPATTCGLTATRPATTGNFIQRVGIALSADTILVRPSIDVGTAP